jgi:hypothetical protein
MNLQTIVLRVYRRLDNRVEGLGDDSPRAVELHNRRKNALHELLDDDPLWRKEDWGLTNDSKAHEYVDLQLHLRPHDVEISENVVKKPSLAYLGDVLTSSALEPALVQAVKALIVRLQSQLLEEKYSDLCIMMPHDVQISFRPQWSGPTRQDFALTVMLPNGRSVTMNYEATQQDIAELPEL